MKYRRNGPITSTQANAMKDILTAHGYTVSGGTASNPRRHKRRRRISAAHRRVLLKNLRKARRVRARKISMRRRRYSRR
jgi:hypothetical protein